jgi:predicted NAD-dependent protein-ADP-ribosyltransferase YbiA (DUF1768 family)
MNEPQNDDIDHINIYSKGKSELGRLLSNFANTPFVLPEDGKFASIEGYWYWLLCEPNQREQLRCLHGFEAKKLGRELPRRCDMESEILFRTKICNAILEKISQNLNIKELMITSVLPFDHYYVYDGKMVRTKYDWLVRFFEKVRIELKSSSSQKSLDLF